MNHSALLKRAWTITKRFRVLWLFGFLVALTSGGSGGGGSGSGYNFNGEELRRGNWPDWLPVDKLRHFDPGQYVGLIVLCCCILVLFAIAALIVQYVARAALVRSVDQIEATGGAPTWRTGLRLGWSQRTFRLWLLELIVGIGVGLAALLLLTVCASPLLLLLIQNDITRAIGIALTVLLELLAILILIVAGIALNLMGQFWTREIVLADRSIGEALAAGYTEVRGRLKDIGVLWLLMVGIAIGFTIVMLPLILLLFAIAGALGGGLGYAVYSLSDSVPWAIVVGLPIFLLVLGIPLTFVSGLYEVFKSSVWTLAYREVTS